MLPIFLNSRTWLLRAKYELFHQLILKIIILLKGLVDSGKMHLKLPKYLYECKKYCYIFFQVTKHVFYDKNDLKKYKNREKTTLALFCCNLLWELIETIWDNFVHRKDV